MTGRPRVAIHLDDLLRFAGLDRRFGQHERPIAVVEARLRRGAVPDRCDKRRERYSVAINEEHRHRRSASKYNQKYARRTVETDAMIPDPGALARSRC
jgi:hypothetical protein